MTDDEELALLAEAREAGYELERTAINGRPAWRWVDIDRAWQPVMFSRDGALRLMRARLARRDVR